MNLENLFYVYQKIMFLMKNSINIIDHFQIRCHCQVFLTYDPLKANFVKNDSS